MKIYVVMKFYHDYEKLVDVYKNKKDAEKKVKEIKTKYGGDIFSGADIVIKDLK